MTTENIMNRDIIALASGTSVAEGVARLIDGRYYSLPVVDQYGRYLGMFGVHQVVGKLLPRAATLEQGIRELGFVKDSQEYLRERLAAFADHPVDEFIDTAVPQANNSMPLTEALFLLYQGTPNIPVLEDGQVTGILSSWDILATLTAKQ